MATRKDDYKQIYNHYNASPNAGNVEVANFENVLEEAFRGMVANGYNPRDVLSLALGTLSPLVAEEVLINSCYLYEAERIERVG